MVNAKEKVFHSGYPPLAEGAVKFAISGEAGIFLFMPINVEKRRLAENNTGAKPWKLFGPYLAERQWGTVREDYSPDGTAWEYFPHEAARSRAYRWGEDGIAGISDGLQRLCISLALWNGKDKILKERLFGLTNEQGNHGEDVKIGRASCRERV